MGIITKTTTLVDGTIPTAAQFNGDFDTIYTEFNGAISNANISPTAAIVESKLLFSASGHGHTGGSDGKLINIATDGWISVNDSWAYASASTITVPSGAVSLYQKGDRIKWTQTTVKYGVIVAVADTLLTIAVNTDYVVTNAVISAIYYSHQANPLGYPSSFGFTPAYTGFSSNPSGDLRYSIVGNVCTLIVANSLAGTSNAAGYTLTMPVISTKIAYFVGVSYDNSTWQTTPARASSDGLTNVLSCGKDAVQNNWVTSNGKMWLGIVQVEF
jgi:hypothetical protein